MRLTYQQPEYSELPAHGPYPEPPEQPEQPEYPRPEAPEYPEQRAPAPESD